MKLKILIISLIFVSLAIVTLAAPPVRATVGPALLISEVQTGNIDQAGNEDPLDEFVEITNNLSMPVDLDGPVQLEYLSAANDGSGPPTSLVAYLVAQLDAGQTLLLAHTGYYAGQATIHFGQNNSSTSGLFAKTGGHLRLMVAGSMVDCVSWGSAVPIDGCAKIAGLPTPGSSLQRLRSADGSYDYSRSLSYVTPTTPGQPNAMLPPDLPVDSGQPSVTICPKAVKLSEILANPAGTDSGHEYIELYNSSDQSVALQGCQLKVGTKSYQFSDTQLEAKQFKAFYDSQTGLGLTNDGSTVLLSDSTSNDLDKTEYSALGDDQAWALVGGQWQVTNLPTPNQPNLGSTSAPAKDPISGTRLASLTACPAGKYRNPETGRCKQLSVVAAVKACAAGQERNSATGRCRKISATKTVKPCAASQQRNPDTGRCRKITTTKKLTESKPTGSDPQPEYQIMGAVGLLIVSYGIYEYRHDLSGWWQRWRQRTNEDRLAG